MQLPAAPLQTRETAWEPSSARVTMNVTLDACLVPSAAEAGLRADAAHLVVLDELLEAELCRSIRDFFTGDSSAAVPPADRWERATSDGPAQARTFGLRDAHLQLLQAKPPAGVVELSSRLAKLYPECSVQHQFVAQQEGAAFVCERFVANAAVAGDAFNWHIDADPSALPPPHGGYVNRERGRPLFVSAILYLDEVWPEDADAETLFLDPPTGTGLFVRPRQGRVVLMDQDITHRLSAPSASAGRPRYSLVWKLLFHPRSEGQRCSIARPEWGRPTAFGSAARVEQLGRRLLQEAGGAARSAEPPCRAGELGAAASAQEVPRPLKRRAESAPMTEPNAKVPAAPASSAKRRRSSREAEEEGGGGNNKRAALPAKGVEDMERD